MLCLSCESLLASSAASAVLCCLVRGGSRRLPTQARPVACSACSSRAQELARGNVGSGVLDRRPAIVSISTVG